MNSAQDIKEKKMNTVIIVLAVALVALLGCLCYLTKQYDKTHNTVTIYYKGYANPRIRYRYDNEPWGKVDGEAMPKNTDNIYTEYTHKVVIPLKKIKHRYIKVMFRDDAGNTDDNNKQYYQFEKGRYLFEDGNITKINKEFQITKFMTSAGSAFVGNQIALSVETVNGKSPFVYRYVAKSSTGAEMVIQDFASAETAVWTPSEVGTYILTVQVKDEKGKIIEKQIHNFNVTSLAVKEITPSVPSPQSAGTEITLKMAIDNSSNLPLTCFYEVKKDEKFTKIEASEVGEAKWTPEESGTYTIVAHAESGDIKAEKSIEYTIEEEEVQLSKLTVFYAGIDSPSLYYKTNTSGEDFKSVPMTQDSSMDGYSYRAEIDVEYGSQVMVYFSDGFAVMDDNNGQMYVIQPGYFGIRDNQVTNLSIDQGEPDEDYEDDDDDDHENNGNHGNGNNGNSSPWFNNGGWPFN